MIRSKNRLSLLAIILLAATSAFAAQDFDYGDSELSPEELYDEAIKHLYAIDGYKKNRSAAIANLKKAAAKGYTAAHNTLGSLHLEGNGLFASPRKALRSFEEAANLGDLLGHYNAGYSYLSGRGTTASMPKAEKHFLTVVDKAANKNLSPEDFGTIRNARASAYLYLGIIYTDEEDEDFFDNEKGTKMFHKADELNDPSAAMLLAIRYARGEGAEQDQAKSEEYLERYKLASINKLHNSLSQVFFQGMDRESVKDSYKDFLSKYEDQMTKRIQSMQTSFGVSLLDEEDLFSPEQAYVWLEPVATKDNPIACSRLATLYYTGEGAEQNLEKARELLEYAYKSNVMARHNLAVMLANGEGGPVDLERAELIYDIASKSSWYPSIYYKNPSDAKFITERDAIKLVEENAEKEVPEALYCFGRRKLFGIGVEREFESAKAMILQAAELGNIQARFFYGVYIASDTAWWGATEEDKAIKEAAEANYPPALHHQGEAFLRLRQYDDARIVFEKSAKLGHSPSLYRLGEIYQEGHGQKRDFAKALEYFQQAADLESPIGFLYIGLAYEYGLSVEIDIQKAFENYQTAADLLSYYAHFAMGNLMASGKLGEANWEEAIPHWEKASDLGVRQAILQLGDCYRLGLGVDRNLITANQYYQRSAALSYYTDHDTTYHTALLKLEPESDIYAPKQALGDLRLIEIGGYPLAGYQLAKMNRDGIALKTNPKKAYSKFLKTAALLGKDLETHLGSSFSDLYPRKSSLPTSTQPADKRDEVYREAALDSCFQVAQLLTTGGIKKTNPSDSVTWYEIAAKFEHAPSQLELGKLYLSGKYVEKDEPKGWNLISKAAQTTPEAKYLIAQRYFDGAQQELGHETAVNYLRTAAASGLEKAKALMEKEGIPLTPETENKDSDLPQKKGEDDGFDGAIDINVA